MKLFITTSASISDSISNSIEYYFDTEQQRLWDGTTILPEAQILNITFDPGGNAHSQLRDFIFAIPDYSINKYYKVNATGIFPEIDCIVPAGIFLEFTDELSGITTNATWTYTTPSDYTFLAEINKDYSTVGQNFKHCLVVHNGGIVKGGNLNTNNTLVKYHIHDDFTTSPNGHAIYSDIKFNGTTSTGFCIGGGLRDLENRSLVRLEALSPGNEMIFFHNTSNQNDICILEIINCNTNARPLLVFSGQKSNQNDIVIVSSITDETVRYVQNNQVAMDFQLGDNITLIT